MTSVDRQGHFDRLSRYPESRTADFAICNLSVDRLALPPRSSASAAGTQSARSDFRGGNVRLLDGLGDFLRREVRSAGEIGRSRLFWLATHVDVRLRAIRPLSRSWLRITTRATASLATEQTCLLIELSRNLAETRAFVSFSLRERTRRDISLAFSLRIIKLFLSQP